MAVRAGGAGVSPLFVVLIRFISALKRRLEKYLEAVQLIATLLEESEAGGLPFRLEKAHGAAFPWKPTGLRGTAGREAAPRSLQKPPK